MRRLLIGPALTGAAVIAGSHYGAQARQVVHKSPSDTYGGISAAFANMGDHGTTAFEGGKPMPYELRYDRDPGRQLTVHVLFGGREGETTEIDFAPKGQDTLVTARAHGDRAVLSEALAGTSKARLAYAPDWMLNLLVVRPLLQQFAGQIEKGQPPQIAGQSAADWESSLPPDQQKQVQDHRQYQATQPAVDPDASAQTYLNGSSN